MRSLGLSLLGEDFHEAWGVGSHGSSLKHHAAWSRRLCQPLEARMVHFSMPIECVGLGPGSVVDCTYNSRPAYDCDSLQPRKPSPPRKYRHASSGRDAMERVAKSDRELKKQGVWVQQQSKARGQRRQRANHMLEASLLF